MLGDIQELNTREEVRKKKQNKTLSVFTFGCFFFFPLLLTSLNLCIIVSLCRQSYPKSTAGQKRSWRSLYSPTLCLIIHCSETKTTHSWENTNKNTRAHTLSEWTITNRRPSRPRRSCADPVQIRCPRAGPPETVSLTEDELNMSASCCVLSDQTHILSQRLESVWKCQISLKPACPRATSERTTGLSDALVVGHNASFLQ